MTEENPDKIKKADIVVGIPSLNEADSISWVTKQVDEGLSNYFPHQKAVIINCDNNSPDGTGRVFLATRTKTPKIYLSTAPGVKGKGSNFYNLFLKVKKLGAKGGASVDADLKSITPEWLKCLLSPIIEGYDYVSPIYLRHKNDGTITNHLCYPLVYGLLAQNIRQPIGGDMGFSRKLVEYWLDQEWTESTREYGIDIFMTLNAIRGEFKLAQVNLGSKIHKPSAPKLNSMFLQVTDSLFHFLSENKDFWIEKREIETPPLLCDVEHKVGYQEVIIDPEKTKKDALSEFEENFQIIEKQLPQEVRSQIEKIFLKEKSLELPPEIWPKIVYDLFYIYHINSNKKSLIKVLRALYFARILSFLRETTKKTQQEAEQLIQKQAQLFFAKRYYLINKLNKAG